MSITDDKIARAEALLGRAGEKCIYGKSYSPAYDLADRIRPFGQAREVAK
jgi:hypothetical protein